MMDEFSTIVYRGYGPHQRKGGGFSTLGCLSVEAYEAALADGWFATLPEAIAAHDKPKESLVVDLGKEAAETATAVDNAPPSRAEIEKQCAELGIKVHHRHSDASLLKMIDEKLAE